ncbi:MAG: malectin domain-containing carbohydrate-binding protein [Chitinophagaceae bacterium]
MEILNVYKNYSTFSIATIEQLLRRSVHLLGILFGNGRLSKLFTGLLLCLFGISGNAQENIRQDILLSNNWKTIAGEDSTTLKGNFWETAFNEKNWKKVSVPHNWDDYYGYRRVLHGNLHGDSWYRTSFIIKKSVANKRYFLFFEGVGSYATVYVNGKYAGAHAGGRTSFTIDVTNLVKKDAASNVLAVRAWHPANIKDLPWVCGGCSDERGFSEGSQPMGIFRPVHLITTNQLRIQPFGIHAWAELNNGTADLSIDATIKNYATVVDKVQITHQLKDAAGKIVVATEITQSIKPGDSITVSQKNIRISNPILWNPESPYLYTIVTIVKAGDKIIDQVSTPFGFRTVQWKTASHQLLVNGKPVFINGIAEYEHLLGGGHAFSNEQIAARMKWVKAAGFNAFRDAHQPHNLLYGHLCDEQGLLWWPQLSAHIWYDSPEFRKNFKQLLREWIIERRNEPSVILWGLQNESKLPEDFAKECSDLIRQLDPTATTERLITTCNGGTGTDWDVPQNWTGTYGGNPATYAEDIKKQILIGEYGAWRTLDLHTEGGFAQNGVLSEDRMVQLMEQKIRLAESVRDSCAGQFFWLLTSHDNPGRVQGGEGAREMDRIGPVNYKGMLTPWEEPTDAYYMFRSNYASAKASPMVYIVSHTWPNRWTKPGVKNGIVVYSNCDEVELFNDIDKVSLGKKTKAGIGTHFQWDGVNIQYNVLYAVGYVDGKQVARDTILLQHLPQSPNYQALYAGATNITQPKPDYNYIYRVNCGGPDYTDENGNLWKADRHYEGNVYGSSSWSDRFPGMSSFFASQRRIFTPVKGTNDWPLFQDFRYGRDELKYNFPLPDGDYLLELYFIEPWLGVGGGINANNMRMFDIAVNGSIVLQNLDVWKEAGSNSALKKTLQVRVNGGKLSLSFPNAKVGEAIIAAVAIASAKKDIMPIAVTDMVELENNPSVKLMSWLDIGNKQYADKEIKFSSLPANLFGADWLQFNTTFNPQPVLLSTNSAVDLFIGIKKGFAIPEWLKEYERTQTIAETDEQGGISYDIFRKRLPAKSRVQLPANTYGDVAYIAMMLPVTNMQPAYDLKPTVAYKASAASFSAGVQKEMLNDKEAIIMKSAINSSIQWPVQTGVGDRYAITVKYFYPSEKEVKGRLQMINTGGTMMLDETVKFTFTRAGKWNSFTVNTPTMINAGNYTVKLLLEDATGLAVSGIELQ